MVRRFVKFVLIEEIFIVGSIAWSYMKRPTESGPWVATVVIMLFGAAVAISNAIMYLQIRDAPWHSLGTSKKLQRVLAAIVTTFTVFLITLACVGLLMPLSLTTLLRMSAIAAFSFGMCGLIGLEITRGGSTDMISSHLDEQDEDPAGQGPTLRAIISGIEADAAEARLRQPRALRKMLASIRCDDGRCSLEEVLGYFSRALEGVDRADSRASLDLAHSVDALFSDVLVGDIEWHAEEWKNNAAEVLMLLDKTEQLLIDALSEDGAIFSTRASGNIERLGDASLYQRLQAYACIAASLANNEHAFHSRMDMVLAQVEANIDFILGREDAFDLAMLESAIGWGSYNPHSRCWTAPIAILSHAAAAMGREREIIEAYEHYICHLRNAAQDTDILGNILLDTQLALAFLQGSVIREELPDVPIHI